ncbi:protein TPX2-like [Tripterygium wilfordii]|uniref:protein TPX2-like n=1 Tax=Tripterygium wilfordii TaxID=458696 RepID=UPI0018F84F01|nr:protein TPX2-like [Tripterygium wilfordii]
METPHTKSPNKTRNEARDRLDKSKGRPTPTTTKAAAKENTKPQEFRLHTGQRALRRAMFNYSVATKIYMTQLQKKQVEKLHKIIEEEEVRMMRKEMVPRAQLMPLFDRPFFPQRSNRPLTVPKEPSFKMLNSKCWSCISDDELHHFQHALGFQAH